MESCCSCESLWSVTATTRAGQGEGEANNFDPFASSCSLEAKVKTKTLTRWSRADDEASCEADGKTVRTCPESLGLPEVQLSS